MIRTFSIKAKLLLAFLSIAIFGLVSAYLTIVNQQNYSRHELLVEQHFAAIEALLEMKSAANEIDKQVITFQSAGDSATKKNELLANLENLDKWKNVYKQHVGTNSREDSSFIERLEGVRNSIVDTSLLYLSLKEQSEQGPVLTIQGQKLEADIVELKQVIGGAIIKKRADVREAKDATALIAKINTRENLTLSFAALSIALLFGFLLTSLIARPIIQLRDSAIRIAQGDLTSRISIRTSDELGELAVAFNNMSAGLKDSRIGLEKQVEETGRKAALLKDQVTENEKSKAAILNLLEDVEEEKKHAEQTVVERTQELRVEKARLLASINALSFGFVLADANDIILLENPALAKILDISGEIRSIHDIAKLLQTSESKINIDIAGSCKRCMELKEPVEFKEVSYGKKFLRIICTPVTASKNTIGYIFLVEDITEAKVMERSREEFFAVASHELRTPLTAIRGNADMILSMYTDKILDKDMKEMLEDINASSVRLIDVVNDFLEVSRLEQGKVELKKENFAVAEILEKVARDLKTITEKKGLSLTYRPPADPLSLVFADKNKTEQIVLNLLGNATKFTREGGITLTAMQEAGFLKIRVSDTGAGISEHNQALLFRKFQQAGEDMLARDVTQSTGLGLYISRLIVTSMGGEIGLERSELGKGSTFFFTIPIAS